jgi:hypothetical protein
MLLKFDGMSNVVEHTAESYPSGQDDIIDRNEEQLNDVADGAHHSEANGT